VIIRAGFQQWRFAITAVLLVLLLILFQVPALAEGGGDGCNPGRTNNYSTVYFSGSDDASGTLTYGGMYGNIYEYSPYVYPQATTTIRNGSC